MRCACDKDFNKEINHAFLNTLNNPQTRGLNYHQSVNETIFENFISYPVIYLLFITLYDIFITYTENILKGLKCRLKLK